MHCFWHVPKHETSTNNNFTTFLCKGRHRRDDEDEEDEDDEEEETDEDEDEDEDWLSSAFFRCLQLQ
eukprot:11681163-Heterocapsa_arctica.AAC.1